MDGQGFEPRENYSALCIEIYIDAVSQKMQNNSGLRK